MSNNTSRDVWALVCDDDVQDMSDALGRQYSLSEFVVARVEAVNLQRVTAVHTVQRVDTRSDRGGFLARLDSLREAQCEQIFALIAQLSALVGEPVAGQSGARNIAAIMQLGVGVLRRIEALLESGGDGLSRISSDAFRRTLADLSLILSNNVNRHSVFVDATYAIAVAGVPDEAWIERALAGSGKHYVLVPFSFDTNDE